LAVWFLLAVAVAAVVGLAALRLRLAVRLLVALAALLAACWRMFIPKRRTRLPLAGLAATAAQRTAQAGTSPLVLLAGRTVLSTFPFTLTLLPSLLEPLVVPSLSSEPLALLARWEPSAPLGLAVQVAGLAARWLGFSVATIRTFTCKRLALAAMAGLAAAVLLASGTAGP
jgi:hypothetical protein